MGRIFSRVLLLAWCILSSLISFGQDKPEMADAMRGNGKIYVVVTVILIILTGLFGYVWSIDRKIRKAEKER